jgi:hypothetical protein
MNHIKPYKIYELNSDIEPINSISKEQNEFLKSVVKGEWKLNSEGLVDVQGNVNCSKMGISDFKGIKFGRVSGYFDCSNNNLESLEGCPKEVVYGFLCYKNPIRSLIGSPSKCWNFISSNCKELKSLEGCPQIVTGDFICSDCNLESIEGAPEKIRLNFDCSKNKIKSLKGGPNKVGNDYICSYNEIENLEGSPFNVGGTFDFSNNRIDSLDGIPPGYYNYGNVDFAYNKMSERNLKFIYARMRSYREDFYKALISLKKISNPQFYKEIIDSCPEGTREKIQRKETEVN